MNPSKPVFLVSKAMIVSQEGPEGYYDEKLHLTTISEADETPLVLSGVSAPTQSKTFQRPTDDDPDPGQDRCY